MQMFKKSVALVLSILMLLSMLTVAAGMSAFAAESYKVTAKSTQGYFTDLDKTYKAGDEFDLKVYLTADQLITDGQIDVEFNSNALYVTSVTTGEKLSSKVRPTINKTDKVQTTQNLISINFSCPVDPETGVDAADYKTEGLFFTVHFQVKNEIAADQAISFNIKALSGTTDVMKYSSGFAYVNNSTVQTTGASLRAQLGEDSQPTTDPVTTAPPTTAPPTTAPPTTASPTTVPPTTAPPTTVPPTTQVSTTEPQETTAPVSTYTTKFTNNKGWNDVYLYAWSSQGGEMAAWPGTKLTDKSTNGLGEEQYTATFDSKYDNIIFSNGSEQTVDITYDPSVTGYYPTEKNINGKWEVGTWTDQPETVPETTEAQETTQPQGTTSAVQPTTSAADGIVVTAKSAQNLFADITNTYKAGDEFDLKVYLSANELITDGQIDVKFDSNALFVSKVTAGGKLAEKVTPIVNKTEKVQTTRNLISINFSCPVDPETGVDAADYKNEELFFTIHFQIKPNVTDDQTVIFDILALTGTTDVMKYSAGFPYVNNGVVQTAGATLRAELDGSTTPEPTTAAPTTVAQDTTAPEPEMYTFYYLPSADQENAGNKYKLNYNDPNGVAPENWHQYDFVKTPITVDGVNIYSVSVPKDFDDVTTLQYQVYNTANEWVSQNEFAPAKLSNFDNQVVKADGTIDVKPTEPATEGTTAAPEDTTAAPEPTTVAPTVEPTTVAPTVEPTTVAPTVEPTTATPTVEPTTTPEPTTVAPTVEPTTAVPTVEPTTATPTVKPTEAPTLAPSKVDFNKNPDEKSAVNAIAKAKSDGDPKGSVFNKLKAKVAKTTKNSNKITWNKVKGAKKYIIMGNKCGKAANGKFNAFKKIKTTTGKSFTQKKLKKGTYYKYLVLAVNAKGKVISASKVIHVATKGGKVTNYKSLKLNKTSKTLKKGKTFKLKVTKKTKMNKKGKVKNHRKIKFESANTKIATV
ncbi:MAG: starch-binding protein, partial [Ruminococcus sp.]|nr:starch-binding protein [Ruminococcus sp.]